MKQSNTYPGFWQAVALCVTFVVLQILFLIPFVILDAIFELHLASHPAVIGVINLGACALVITMGWRIGRPTMSEVWALRRVSGRAVAGVIVASGGAIILLSEVDNLVRFILPAPEWIVRLFADLSAPSGNVGSAVFLLVMVAPVTEELLFRGLILRGLLQRFGATEAFLLSSMLFGLVHLNPWQFVSAAALGVLFAWWYARTRSLIPSVLGHALVNATVVGHRWLPFEVRGFNAGQPFARTEFQPLGFDVLGVLLLATGLWLFHRATPTNQSQLNPSPEQPPRAIAPGSDQPPI